MLKNIHPNIASAYIYISERAGLVVMEPLRVRIQMEDSQISQVAMTLIRYSPYPILLVEEGQEDLLLTNVLEEYQVVGGTDKVTYMIYDLPLTNVQMNEFIHKALKKRCIIYSVEE